MFSIIEKIFKLFEKLFHGKGEVYYVNGAENLPAPLTKEKEEEILCEFQNSNYSNRELLITHNLRLVVYIARKFENTGIDFEDLISIGTIGLMKAINTFNLDKNIKLATYASRCIDNEILMFVGACAGSTGGGFKVSRVIILFKKTTGITPAKYILNLRIEESVSLLTSTELSLEEIAERTGFGSSTYMNRIFKQKLGCTPGKFRSK